MPLKQGYLLKTSRITVISVFLGTLIAVLALLGWTFHIELLKRFDLNWPSIKANVTIGIIFTGVSLFLFIEKKNSLAFFFAAIIFLIGIMTLSEHIFNFNAHIDEILFLDPASPNENNHGRMAQFTSIAFIIIGFSLFTYPAKRKWLEQLSQIFIILVLIMSFAAFLGTLYYAGKSFRTANIASFSLPTALAGIFMCIGILFSKTDRGLLSIFYNQTLAGKAILRGVFVSVLILIVIGWLCVKGVRAGTFDAAMGIDIMITVFTVSFLLIALPGLRRLNKSEKMLIASEKNLRHVLSSTADVYYVVDRNYYITLINEMAERNLAKAWGKTVKAGINILDVIPDESNEPIRKSFDRVFKGEKIEYELHQDKWNDLPGWVSVNYNPVTDNNGVIIGAYIVTKDITKRKKAEQELKQSNNRFELISRTTNDAIWEWNLETGELWSNATHQELYGLSSNDPVPKENRWAERIHPDDRENILKMQEASLLSEKNVFITEYRFNVAGKGYRNIYDRCYIVRDSNGKAIRMMGSMVDITEQKRIEDELRKSEQKYRSLIEQASDYIMITDTKGNFIDVNSSLCKTFGYTLEDLLTKNISDIIDPTQLKYDPIRFDLLLQGQSMLRERRMIKKDGTIIEVEASFKMLPDGRILAIARNIEERKKAELELRKSEETRRLIMDSALDAIVGMDTNGIITVWTPQAEKIFGWEEKDILGRTVADAIIPLQYKAKHIEGLKKYLEIRKAIALNKLMELSALHRDGREFPIEINIVPIKQGETEFFCAFIRDITERKKAEEALAKSENHLRTIVQAEPECVKLLTINCELEDMNPAGLKMIEAESLEDVKGKSVLGIINQEYRKKFKELTQSIFKGGSGFFEFEITGLKGTRRWLETHAVPLKDAEGKIIFLLGVTRDITERKKAEQEVQQSYIAIRQLTEHLQNIREEERAHIAREIHDELGQQLTVLKMDASWLNKKLSSSDENVQQKLKDLLELLDGTVRTVRKISSELRPSLLDDMGLAAAMEWHLKEFEKRMSIKTKFSAPQQDIILSDATKTGLFRIFQESLTNVARHAGAKKVEIKLQQQNGNIILSIKDDGKGFDNEKVTDKKTLGILGMRERSFMMGGNYQINSKPGEGTLVVVSVPDANN